MAVFCVNEHSELIAFTESKLGKVSDFLFTFQYALCLPGKT